MKMSLFKNRKHKRIGDSGMSIVTVIVAVGFVAILVSTIMLASVVNFKMKSVNVYAKESFYSAEQALDEINVGLQIVASDAMSDAYKQIMTTYAKDGLSPKEKEAKFKDAYYVNIKKKLCNLTGPDTYEDGVYLLQPKDDSTPLDNTLYGLLKESTRWHKNDTDPDKSYGTFLRPVADIPSASATDYYTGRLVTYNDTGIVLEGVRVFYKDPTGYISVIETDIRLAYPKVVFADADMPDINNYAFITDTALVQTGGVGSYATTTIKGNSFAYAIDSVGVEYDMQPGMDTKTDLHLVATDFNLKSGNLKTNEKSSLWAGNILLDSSDADIAGHNFVLNDLNLKGKGSDVKIKDYYTGFGNRIDNSGASSAILINGTKSTLDLSKVSNLFSFAKDPGSSVWVKECLCSLLILKANVKSISNILSKSL